MVHYQVILAYDGTDFQGFQRQNGVRTVQGEVEKALAHLGWQDETILSAGRTDTGVHASGQVLAFQLDWPHSPEKLCSAMNALLPTDVSARGAAVVDPSFHPRFDATSREYCYRVLLDPMRDCLLERHQWRVYHLLQPDLLQQAASLFVGRHDFKKYGSPPRPSSSTVREITLSHWVVNGPQLQYHVRANAFLYHMVRRLVFIQVAVATGKVDLHRLSDTLEEGVPDHPGIAPAHGLELVKVEYGEKSLASTGNN